MCYYSDVFFILILVAREEIEKTGEAQFGPEATIFSHSKPFHLGF